MNWLRNQAGQGLSVLRSLTEASSINFVSTNAVQDTLLARLQDEMERAMEAENYDLANQCKRDISLLLLPSQQSQRPLQNCILFGSCLSGRQLRKVAHLPQAEASE